MNKEIEVRFLEIDIAKLITRLQFLSAKDQGEKILDETIFYDREGTWRGQGKFVRLRISGEEIKLTYKEHVSVAVDGATEIELELKESANVTAFLEQLGLVLYRQQQKKRHTFLLHGVTVDIDTWPGIPTYVELEGESEEALRAVAKELVLDWNQAVFDDAATIIQKKYNTPVLEMKEFLFPNE